jgi:hypothetical protein
VLEVVLNRVGSGCGVVRVIENQSLEAYYSTDRGNMCDLDAR